MGKGKNAFTNEPEKLSREDLEREYKRLLESRRSLQASNKSLREWLGRVTDNQSFLSVTANLVFQAMAERAGMRRHPAISEIVKAFDKCVGSQWKDDGASLPEKIELPENPILYEGEEENGDAEMLCTARLAKALEPFEIGYIPRNARDEKYIGCVNELVEAVHEALESMRDQVKRDHGFKPVDMTIMKAPDYDEMTRDQLIDIIRGMSMVALDLAQDMNFTRTMLRYDLRDSAYRRIHRDLYKLAFSPSPTEYTNFCVKVLGCVEPE